MAINSAMIEIATGISANPLLLPIIALPRFPSEGAQVRQFRPQEQCFHRRSNSTARHPFTVIPLPTRPPTSLTWPDETTRTKRRTQRTTVVVLDAARRPLCCSLTQHYSPAASPLALQFFIREGRSSTSIHDATSLASVGNTCEHICVELGVLDAAVGPHHLKPRPRPRRFPGAHHQLCEPHPRSHVCRSSRTAIVSCANPSPTPASSPASHRQLCESLAHVPARAPRSDKPSLSDPFLWRISPLQGGPTAA